MCASKMVVSFVLWVLCLVISTPASFAEIELNKDDEIHTSVEDADILFLLGYHEFISGKFDQAAEHFFQSSKSQGDQLVINKARLFLALSQAKLKNKLDSAQNAAKVNFDQLDSRERELFKRLKYYLGIYFETAYNNRIAAEEVAEKTFFWVLPYAGSSTYSAESQKETALFYGLYGLISKKFWALSLSGEKSQFKFKNGLQDYTQSQGSFAFTGIFENAATLSARYTAISSNLFSQDGIKVYGLGSSFWPMKSLKMNIDLYYATHPQSELGSMTINQISANLDYWFISNAEYDLWLRFGDQAGKASARDIQNGSSFIKNKIYNRIFSEVNFRIDHLLLGASVWSGDEYFGIRNERNLIFSATEEHIGGLSAYGAYMINKDNKFQLTVMKENINVNGIRSNSTTLVGMLTYLIN